MGTKHSVDAGELIRGEFIVPFGGGKFDIPRGDWTVWDLQVTGRIDDRITLYLGAQIIRGIYQNGQWIFNEHILLYMMKENPYISVLGPTKVEYTYRRRRDIMKSRSVRGDSLLYIATPC
jgi:hypothetical protein